MANLFNGRYLELDDSEFSIAHSLLGSAPDAHIVDHSRSTGLLERLTRNGFLISGDFDELDELQRTFVRKKFLPKDAGLAVVLTHACNLRCVYCNQDHRTVRLSNTDEVRFKRFFSRHIDELDRIAVTWWGGEPLLETDRIQSLSEHFIAECDAKGVEYSAYTSTNGVLISDAVAKLFRACRFRTIQISIDGPKEHHDFHRPNVGGRGTFDKIQAGIECLDKEFEGSELDVVIRVNISAHTPTDPEEWRRLLDWLSKFVPLVKISFVPVIDTFRFSEENVLPNDIYHERFSFLFDLAADAHIPIAEDSILTRKGELHCGAVANKNWFLLPDSHLTKCTMKFDDPDEYCGHLDDAGNVELNDVARDWLSFSPFDHHLCSNCDVLLACMGGCQLVDFAHHSGHRCNIKNAVASSVLRQARDRMERAN
ncbi:MAG: radical SAM protein [Pseudomonadota bacterium]